MKKIIAIILAVFMLISLCACAADTPNGEEGPVDSADTNNETVDISNTDIGDDESDPIEDTDTDTEEDTADSAENNDDDSEEVTPIGGADEPTDILVSDNDKLPSEIKWEETILNDEFAGFCRTFTAYAKDGSVMWTYKTGNSMAAQVETIEYIGMYNNLVYINEQALYDSEVNVEGMVEVYGRLRALDAETGEVLWDSTDYDGGSSSWDFDEEGNIYIGGYFGPDCIKIGKEGETYWKVGSADGDAYWMYSLEYKDGEIALSYEMNDLGEEETVIISAENGERLR